MSASPVSAKSAAPVPKPLPPESDNPAAASRSRVGWKKYVTPLLVVALALAVFITITRNWNTWEGGKLEQITDDAYVRGDLTPLSTKVAGIVRAVHVEDFQQVHKGDLIVELQDDDYRAQVDQAVAAVAAARAAIENNRRQRELQDSRIAKALAGIDQAKAQIAAAEAGKEAVQAQLVRAHSERKRQEALYQTHSTTQQTSRPPSQTTTNCQHSLPAAMPISIKLKPCCAAVNSLPKPSAAAKPSSNRKTCNFRPICSRSRRHLAAANVNLGYTKIYAPGDGTVGERQVRPGQLVSPGTQVISFVDLTKWVQANYRETQLTNVKVGDAAELRIDEYPGQLIRGKVLEIAPASGSQFALLPPDNATGNFTKVVQRIRCQNRTGRSKPSPQSYAPDFPWSPPSGPDRNGNLWQLRPYRSPVRAEIARRAAAAIPSEISTRPLLGILGVVTGAGLVTLAGRMLSLGLADLKGHVGISFDNGAWLDSAYNASLMFIGPFTVYLGGLLGPRRILLFAAGSSLVTSLFLPLIHSYSLLIVALDRCRAHLRHLLSAHADVRPSQHSAAIPSFHHCPLRDFCGRGGEYRAFALRLVQGPPLLGVDVLELRRDCAGDDDMHLLRYSADAAAQERAARRRASSGSLYLSAGLALIFAALQQGQRLDWWRSGVFNACFWSGCFFLLCALDSETTRS